jgi:hypothetical protein
MAQRLRTSLASNAEKWREKTKIESWLSGDKETRQRYTEHLLWLLPSFEADAGIGRLGRGNETKRWVAKGEVRIQMPIGMDVCVCVCAPQRQCQRPVQGQEKQLAAWRTRFQRRGALRASLFPPHNLTAAGIRASWQPGANVHWPSGRAVPWAHVCLAPGPRVISQLQVLVACSNQCSWIAFEITRSYPWVGNRESLFYH